ncbi:MAG: DUF2851 family protein [Verrucomicrobia subdivision 3 bacterium]|nr:DUF2851 family protein [Limisphaerales bacterium]
MTGSFYSQWRAQSVEAQVRETAGDTPPERLMQSIWQHQRLRREALLTTDGRPVRVLHPGFWNHEAGPDFQRAVIQVGDVVPACGDVEVDSTGADWRAHGHHTNPAFGGVIFHVIWNGPAKIALPTLRMQPHIDAPLAELADWQAAEPWLPLQFAGKCRAPLAELTIEHQETLLSEAAAVRLGEKADTLARHARRHGWESALWHGLFRALGYKNNTWPMQHLADHLPTLRAIGTANAMGWQARLLGVGGLLTDNLPAQTPAARKHLRALWDCWWRERDAFENIISPKTVWRFGGLRPANHPIRRLALLAHWLARADLLARLEQWLHIDFPKTKLASSLTETLAVQPESFWKHHWTFRSPPQPKPCALLGTARVTDLAINVILPWFHARAVAGNNSEMQSRIAARYAVWPPSQDNAILKLARQRLFGTPRRLANAAAQQGLIQITRDFCDHAPATCEGCAFPDLVRGWAENFDLK